MELNILRPDPSVLVSGGLQGGETVVRSMPQRVYPTETIEYTEDEGILLYKRGLLYPEKGFPTPEAIYAINPIKRLILGYIRVFTFPLTILSFLPFIILPFSLKKKVLEKILDAITQPSIQLIYPHAVQQRYLSPAAKYSGLLIEAFLVRLGINQKLAHDFAFVISQVIEYDNAYRYRLQDAFSETTRDALLHRPSREFIRIAKEVSKREPSQYNRDKFIAIGYIFGIAALFPRFRKSIRYGVGVSDISKIQLDAADEYHCLFRNDYDYMGASFEERWEQLKRLHNGTIPGSFEVGGEGLPVSH